jgi:hypothetical protein
VDESKKETYQVVVHDETQETVEKSEIDLFVDLRQLSFHQDVAFSLASFPNFVQVVDSLTPLVDEERSGFGIGGLDPGGEETTFVGFEIEELIEVSIGDLLHRFNVVTRDELVVGVEELNSCFLERALGEEESLDSGEGLVRVVVGLFDEGEFFSLRLVKSSLDTVGFLELLEREDEEFRVVLVRERREGDRSEFA